MFKVRTSPVEVGTVPYVWNIPSVYQCVWYCYYRALECGFSPCEWWDRETNTGSYTNAKEWLKNYRDPWIPITDPNYKPVAGDILVYDGELGHVIFCESNVLTSEYRNGDPNSFRNAKIGDYKGVLLGVLHYPYEPISPVERDENKDQIETTDETLRIRTAPSLNAEIVGHVQIGFYNVLDTKKADGYTWYEIAENRWCADITTKFYPKTEEDFIRQLEKFLNDTRAKITALESENNEIKADMNTIKNIAERWVK